MSILKPSIPCAFAAAVGLLANAGAQAQEQARVIAATPVYQTVTELQQQCSTSPVVVNQPKSGAGAALGAIAGGALGAGLGHGPGKGAAAAVGALGGAVLGDRLEEPGTAVQNVQTCTTQPVQHSKLAYYDVKYEFAGRQYAVQMPNDPGPFIVVNVTPQVATVPAPSAMATPMPMPTPTAPTPSNSVITYGVAPAPTVVQVMPAYPRVWLFPQPLAYAPWHHHHRWGWR